MLCDWCDEVIVMETGDYKLVFWQRADGKWDEVFFHDYCFEDGTRGEHVSENEDGELEIRL